MAQLRFFGSCNRREAWQSRVLLVRQTALKLYGGAGTGKVTPLTPVTDPLNKMQQPVAHLLEGKELWTRLGALKCGLRRNPSKSEPQNMILQQ